MDTVEKAMNYVTKINNSYLGVYPDIGNLKNASLIYTSVVEDIEQVDITLPPTLKKPFSIITEKSVWNWTYPIYRMHKYSS